MARAWQSIDRPSGRCSRRGHRPCRLHIKQFLMRCGHASRASSPTLMMRSYDFFAASCSSEGMLSPLYTPRSPNTCTSKGSEPRRVQPRCGYRIPECCRVGWAVAAWTRTPLKGSRHGPLGMLKRMFNISNKRGAQMFCRILGFYSVTSFFLSFPIYPRFLVTRESEIYHKICPVPGPSSLPCARSESSLSDWWI